MTKTVLLRTPYFCRTRFWLEEHRRSFRYERTKPRCVPLRERGRSGTASVCFVRKVFTMDRIPRLESNEEKLRDAVIQKYQRGTPFQHRAFKS